VTDADHGTGQIGPAAPAADSGTQLSLGLFRCGNLTLGFPTGRLAEVARVPAVLPMLDCSRSCLGSIDLRGLHVPLFDLRAFRAGPGGGATASGSPEPPPLAAVLSVDARMVAVAVDAVLGLARVPDVAPASGDQRPDPDHGRLRVAALIHRGHLVNLVDPDALVRHPDVATVPDRRSSTLALSRVKRRQMIQFDVGGATLAIPAVAIHATLPRRSIARNALTGGICLGSIDLPQGSVAVVSASAVFGIGTATMSDTSEVIVIPLGHGAVIGLAVERILRIAEIDLGHAVPIPRATGEGLLSASLVDPAGAALFLVDPEALRTDRRLLDLSAVTTRWTESATAAARTAGDENTGGAVERRRERFLLVDAGPHLAVPICAVTRILPAPTNVIRLNCPDPRVIGLTVFDREVLPLVRPGRADFDASETGRVLIVDTPGARAAVAVRQVLGVVTSAWQARVGGAEARSVPDGQAMIRTDPGAVGAAGRGLHGVVDLAAEVDDIARMLPAARRASSAA
jgi:chemotaxis signal transduction protein